MDVRHAAASAACVRHRMLVGGLLLTAGLYLSQAAAATMQQKVTALVQESDTLVRQRTQSEAAQQSLLQEQQALTTAPDKLAQRQADLNQRVAAHDSKVAAHQQRLQHHREKCNVDGNADGSNTDEHINECNIEMKLYNDETMQIDAEAPALEAEQIDIDRDQAQYREAAASWNGREDQAVLQLNTVYGGLNDWLDRAYAFVTSSAFREEVQWDRMERYCVNRGLPEGTTISPEQVVSYSATYRSCLKRVLDHQRKVAAAAHRP